MSRAAGRRLAPLAAALLLAGCASAPPVRYYLLEAHVPKVNRTEGPRIGVRPFSVDPPYDGDRIVYRPSGEAPEVGFYAYHRWAAPPSRMLAAVAAAALAAAPGIGSAEPAAPGERYDLLLSGRVLALEEIDRPDRVEVRARIALTLTGEHGSTLWSATLERRERAAAREVADVAGALDSALRALFSEAATRAAAALGTTADR